MTILTYAKLMAILCSVVVTAAANALTINYAGSFSFCSATCDSFASLGGAGGAGNFTPSVVSGSIVIDVAPGGSFTSADVQSFFFEVSNPATAMVDPVFNGNGDLLNATSANPLPLDTRVATLDASGMIDAAGQLVDGSLLFTFTATPFSNNAATAEFDLATGDGSLFIFNGIIRFAGIEGAFVTAPVPIPAAIWLFGTALCGFGLVRPRRLQGCNRRIA